MPIGDHKFAIYRKIPFNDFHICNYLWEAVG